MRYRNLLLFSLLAAIWGSAFVAIKVGVGDPANQAHFFDAPVFFAAVRFDLAGLLLLGYAALTTGRWRRYRPADRRWLSDHSRRLPVDQATGDAR